MRFLPLLLFVCLAGCSVKTVPLSARRERALMKNQMTTAEFGGELLDDDTLEFQMFTPDVPMQPVTVPMIQRYGGLPMLEGNVNNRVTRDFILDTGAQCSIVDEETVRRGRMQSYVPSDTTVQVTGIGGEEHAWFARAARLQFGSMGFENFTSLLRRSRTQIHFGKIPIRDLQINLLGCPVLECFRYVTVDYPRKKFVFSGGKRFAPPRDAIHIPMRVKQHLIYIPLRIGERTVQAMVDTGARDEVFLNTELVKELGLEKAAEKGGRFRAAGLGGEVRGRSFRQSLVFIGEVPVKDVVVDTSETPHWQARIGTDLLSRWCVTFDFERGVMWLQK